MRGVTIIVAAPALVILGGASARPTPWAACAGVCGDDTIWTRDGVPDIVQCGTGRDTIYADRHDVVAPDCEVLYRS